MKALMLFRLLLPLAAVALVIAVILAVTPYMHLILWAMVAFVPLFTGACLWWRQRLVRDEATPPFGTGPAPQPGVTRSLERPAVAGRVVARSDVRVRGKVRM